MDQQERQLALWAMQELHATPDRVKQLGSLPFKQAAEGLEKVKVEARKLYKQLAFKWHPDRNPDSQQEAATRFKMLGQVLKELETLQIRQRPPMPMQQVFHVVFHRGTTTATTATTVNWASAPRPDATNANPGPSYDARRVAYIRVF